MSKHDRIIAQLQAKKTPSNIKWTELCSLLEHLGYRKLKAKGGGSGVKFYHEKKDVLICCHRPHPDPCVDKGCIKDITEHLEANGFF